MSPDGSPSHQPMMQPQLNAARRAGRPAPASKAPPKVTSIASSSDRVKLAVVAHCAPLMACHRAVEIPMSVDGQVDEAENRLRELIKHIAAQHQSAFAEFYDATVSRVYGVALRIVRHPEMAEEIVSDVYMQVWRNAARYDQARGRVLGWLLIIARSRALDLLRRQDKAFSHPEPHQLVDEPDDQGRNPQDLMLATESHIALHHALQALTPLQRQLLSLAFFKGLSHTEIVEHAGIPLGSVKTHIRRALIELRNVLGSDDLFPA